MSARRRLVITRREAEAEVESAFVPTAEQRAHYTRIGACVECGSRLGREDSGMRADGHFEGCPVQVVTEEDARAWVNSEQVVDWYKVVREINRARAERASKGNG